MKAIAKTKPEPGVELVELDTPSPASGEILVKVKYAGICGTDVDIYKWTRDWGLPLPIVLGHEFSGEVVECGRNVTGLQEGDRVVCIPYTTCGRCLPCKTGKPNLCEKERRSLGLNINGAFAQYVLIPENIGGVFKIPKNITFEEAALCEPLAVALHAIENSQVKPGDSAVVVGAGPIGILLMQILKASGVTVLGLQRSQFRLEAARKMGLNVFPPGDDNFVKALKDVGLADVIFEVSGDPSVVSQAVDMVKSGGEIILVGVFSSPSTFNFTSLVDREITIKASLIHQYQTWRRALALITQHTIDVKPLITSVLPLEKAIKGFELLCQKKAIKILLAPNP